MLDLRPHQRPLGNGLAQCLSGLQVSAARRFHIARGIAAAIDAVHPQRQPGRFRYGPAKAAALDLLTLDLLIPGDALLLPGHMGEQLDGALVLGGRVAVAIDHPGHFAVGFVQHLLDVVWQVLVGELLAHNRFERVAHQVPLAHVPVEVKRLEPVLGDVEQRVAAHHQVEEHLVDCYSIVAGLDAAQHHPLQLG